jgi:hypothetical protein
VPGAKGRCYYSCYDKPSRYIKLERVLHVYISVYISCCSQVNLRRRPHFNEINKGGEEVQTLVPLLAIAFYNTKLLVLVEAIKNCEVKLCNYVSTLTIYSESSLYPLPSGLYFIAKLPL